MLYLEKFILSISESLGATMLMKNIYKSRCGNCLEQHTATPHLMSWLKLFHYYVAYLLENIFV